MNFLDTLRVATEQYHLLSYLVVFGAAFIESLPFISLIFPGAVILGFFGFLAGNDIVAINNYFWIFLLGTVIGDVLSYYIGMKSKRLVSSRNRYFLSGQEYIKNHGNKSVFIGRFISPIRPFISISAGFLKMKFSRFFFWNLLAAFFWTLLFGALGYFFGQAWKVVSVWTTRVGLVLLFLFLFLILIWLMKNFILKFGRPLWDFLKSIYKSVKEAVYSNPDFRKLADRYPRIALFLKKRADRSHFAGRPLTYLIIAFIYFLALFLGIVEDVINSDQIVGADVRIENLLYVFRSSHLVRAFLAVTLLGKSYIVITATVALTLTLWLYRKHRQIIGLWVAMAGSAITAMTSKILIHRARPSGVAVYSEDTFSFPSGHATLAMVFYGYIIYLFWLSKLSWKHKMNIWFGGVTLIILIGFSRIYLGVHYFSDVLGGFLLGALWLIIGITLTEWLIHRNIKLPIPAAPKIKKVPAIATLLFICAVFYAYTVATFQPPRLSPEPPETIQILQGTDILDVFDEYELSKYSETLTGRHQAPISFIVAVTDRNSFIRSMEDSDWLLADEIIPSTLIKLGKVAALDRPYDRAPMTPSFWNADVHDLGFEKPTEAQTVRERHHARFWKTALHTPDGKEIYVGTASHDIGLKYFFAHEIDPAIDIERDLLFSDLDKNNQIFNWRKEQFVKSSLGENAAGDQFFSDGKVYILELR